MQKRRDKIRGDQRTREVRVRIAQDAARLISEHGIRDYAQARRKAAERLGVRDEAAMPAHAEVEEALREFQRLFRGATQPGVLRARREAAREAMRFFSAFEPRLVGAVLDGTADEHSAVCLHLYSDDLHAVQNVLDGQRIPYEADARRLKFERERVSEHPAYRFVADGVPFELTVLPSDALRHPPLDRADDKPVERASLAALETLIRLG
ncbi:MAG TPA: hypothetical protein VND91_09035 [Candidatus Saccharimonadia bacterium]|nr:hypothetical protein [Candidatus Saccharimonadia bacterium]